MNRLARIVIIVGSLSLVLATITSALGAHALTRILTPEKLKSWEWATELHFYNSLGLILIGLLADRLGATKLLAAAAGIVMAGLCLFSGSIYLEALGAPEAVGSVAPYGGSSFMLAWGLVGLAALRAARSR